MIIMIMMKRRSRKEEEKEVNIISLKVWLIGTKLHDLLMTLDV